MTTEMAFGMLVGMLSSRTANIDKRIELAREQIAAREANIEKLEDAIATLTRRKAEGG